MNTNLALTVVSLPSRFRSATVTLQVWSALRLMSRHFVELARFSLNLSLALSASTNWWVITPKLTSVPSGMRVAAIFCAGSAAEAAHENAGTKTRCAYCHGRR